jgi:hypothetical protein
VSTTVSKTYNALATTTLESTSPKLFDAYSQDIPFFYWLKKKGKKTVDGGERIRRTIGVRFSSDGGSFKGLQIVSASDQNPVEPAFWDWANDIQPIVISKLDQLHNQGKEKIIDLLDAKMEQARTTQNKRLHVAMYGNGLGANAELEGLKTVMNVNSYTTDSYGGLSRATYSEWRPYCTGSALGTIYSSSVGEALRNAIEVAYVTQSTKGQGAPDLCLTSIQGLVYYDQRTFDKKQIVSDELGDMGFANLKFMGMTIIADPYLNTTDGTCQGASGETFYLLNSKTWEFVIQKGAEFITDGPKELEEQFGTRWDIVLSAQMICTNARANGIVYGATAAT